MTQRDPQFSRYFDFMDARIGAYYFRGNDLLITVYRLGIWLGHEDFPDGADLEVCTLRFEEVVYAREIIRDYTLAPPRTFTGESRATEYSLLANSTEDDSIFEFSGVKPDLSASVQWEIRCRRMQIQLDTENS